jgi:tetratricopeptide (TPR) repeat protein
MRDFDQGQYDHAARQFQKAITNDPQNPDPYYNLAAVYHRIATSKDRGGGSVREVDDLRSRAENLYNQALNRNNRHAESYRGLAVLLAESDRREEAFKLLRSWAASEPDDPNARIELARLYEEHKDVEAAKLYLQQSLEIAPNPRAWSALAQIREREGDLPQALANYRRAYNLNQYQEGVSTRIASLNRHFADQAPWATESDTEVVRSNGNRRY